MHLTLPTPQASAARSTTPRVRHRLKHAFLGLALAGAVLPPPTSAALPDKDAVLQWGFANRATSVDDPMRLVITVKDPANDNKTIERDVTVTDIPKYEPPKPDPGETPRAYALRLIAAQEAHSKLKAERIAQAINTVLGNGRATVTQSNVLSTTNPQFWTFLVPGNAQVTPIKNGQVTVTGAYKVTYGPSAALQKARNEDIKAAKEFNRKPENRNNQVPVPKPLTNNHTGEVGDGVRIKDGAGVPNPGTSPGSKASMSTMGYELEREFPGEFRQYGLPMIATGLDVDGNTSLIQFGMIGTYIATVNPFAGETDEEVYLALEAALDANGLPATYDSFTRTLSLDGVFGADDTLYWAANDTGFGDFLTVSFGAEALPAPPTAVLLAAALLGGLVARHCRRRTAARTDPPCERPTTSAVRTTLIVFAVLASLAGPAPQAGGDPIFRDLPDFYQHQKSGSDAANAYNIPDPAPDDPPSPLKPGYASGNWWEDDGGWCCIAAFTDSLYYLDKLGFPGLFDHSVKSPSGLGGLPEDQGKSWQQRMAFAIEDLAIDMFGLVLGPDPDGPGPRTRSAVDGGAQKTIPDFLAKYGYGPDKLSYSEFFLAGGSVRKAGGASICGNDSCVPPPGSTATTFASLFDAYYREFLRGEDVELRIEYPASAIDPTKSCADQGLPWWCRSYHIISVAGVELDPTKLELWFADPNDTIHGVDWGHPYLDTDALPIGKANYTMARLNADQQTFANGPYVNARITRIFAISPVSQPGSLLLLACGAIMMALNGARRVRRMRR